MEINEITKLINAEIASNNYKLRKIFERHFYLLEELNEKGMPLIKIHKSLGLKKGGETIPFNYFKDLYYRSRKKCNTETKKGLNKKTNTKIEMISNDDQTEYFKSSNSISSTDNVENQWRELFPFIIDNLLNDIVECGYTIEDGKQWALTSSFNSAKDLRALLNKLEEDKEKSKYKI